MNVKNEMDANVKVQHENYIRDLTGVVAIVTGANSGTGLAITKLLYQQGSTVIMACRTMEKCSDAVNTIKTADLNKPSKPGQSSWIPQTNAPNLNSDHLFPPGQLIPMTLDLSDLRSVKSFTVDFLTNFSKLDFLVLNAGSVPEPLSRTSQGLETAFGVMHVANAALVRWLGGVLLKPSPLAGMSARIVYVSSVAFTAGSFHSSLFDGSGAGDLKGEITDNCGSTGPFNLVSCCPALACPHTNGYARAKLANILHAYEFQRRTDLHAASILSQDSGSRPRRLITSSLHPGSVATNIHPFLSSQLMSYFLRDSDTAAFVIIHALLSEDITPGMSKHGTLLRFTLWTNIGSCLNVLANDCQLP